MWTGFPVWTMSRFTPHSRGPLHRSSIIKKGSARISGSVRRSAMHLIMRKSWRQPMGPMALRWGLATRMKHSRSGTRMPDLRNTMYTIRKRRKRSWRNMDMMELRWDWQQRPWIRWIIWQWPCSRSWKKSASRWNWISSTGRHFRHRAPIRQHMICISAHSPRCRSRPWNSILDRTTLAGMMMRRFRAF